MAIMLVVISVEIRYKKRKLKYQSILFGALVGLFNFGNILFYLKAHQSFAENPSTVFAGMNMGVIIIGSLTGIFVFKEKLSKMNFTGLFLALIAIVLIVMSQR
jgi:drug/metabolite transporter (DMT)-like permease